MGFSNLLGLAGLIFIPLIVVLYMLRPKHKPKKIPSLYLWQSVMDEIESASRIHKLRNSILMILQIIAVLLLALILAGLFIKDHDSQSHVIIVVDGSMSMQSTDIEPSRHVRAKDLAIDYTKKLPLGTNITLVSLTGSPDVLINKTQDKSLILSGIESLVVSNSHWDASLVTQTLSALRKNDSLVVYFGDQSLENAKTYLTLKDRDNLAIYKLVPTVFESDQTMAVLTEVYNYGDKKEKVPVSLYLDGLFFGAKEVSVEPGASTKVFFDSMPIGVKEIKASLDVEDVLEADNVAMTVVKEATVQKVLLVSSGNLFLEKVLKLEQNIELYQVSPEAQMIYTGYDLYIFDGLTPEVIPTDGALLFFEPMEDEAFSILGQVKSPDMMTVNHPITYTIEKPEFLVAVTQVYELGEGARPIYETSFGSSAYSWQKGHQKGVVFGFDIHKTDLPLSIEFPILMSSTFKYLLTASTVEKSSIGSGDSIEIYLKPSTDQATIMTPSGQEIPLDLSQAKQLFVGTDVLGTYQVVQASGDEVSIEKFVVNAKKPNLDQASVGNSDIGDNDYNTSRSLKLWLGLVLMMIVLLEWVVYGIRRGSR